MKKLCILLAALCLVPSSTFAAIAYDTSGNSVLGASPNTSTFTTGTISNTIIWVCAHGDGTLGQTFSVIDDGVSMTETDENDQSAGGGNAVALFYGVPTTTVNKITATASAGQVGAMYDSYTGAAQSNPVDVHNATTGASGQSSPFTSTLVTIVNNDWTIACVSAISAASPVASTGTTQRQSSGGNLLGDSNAAITPAGSTSMSVSFSDFPHVGRYAYDVMAAFCPASGCPSPATSVPVFSNIFGWW
jgi:hypothetical protein